MMTYATDAQSLIFTSNDCAARFFGKSVDAWLTVPRHLAELPQIRGSLKYGDRTVALVNGTEALWLGGRRDYDPDLWVMLLRMGRDSWHSYRGNDLWRDRQTVPCRRDRRRLLPTGLHRVPVPSLHRRRLAKA
jgi:hypothetical protein